MILMALVGCGTEIRAADERIEPWSEVPYDRAREACDLDFDDSLALGGVVSEACVARMAEDMGLWLDDSRDANDPNVAYVLSGLHTVLASNQGAASALLDERMPPRLREVVGSHDAGPETPAAAFWYWLLANEIEELLPDPTITALGNNDDGTVSVRPLDNAPMGPDPNGDLVWAPLELFAATILVHEASHGVAPGHLESCAGHCDQDMNGAYGMTAVWAYGWLIAYGFALPEQNCAGTVRRMQVECSHILEPGFPCTELTELFTSCE